MIGDQSRSISKQGAVVGYDCLAQLELGPGTLEWLEKIHRGCKMSLGN